MASELGAPSFPGFSLSAMGELMDHDWPGNIRELRNVVERTVYRAAAIDPMLARPIGDIRIDPFHSPWRPQTTPQATQAPRAAKLIDDTLMTAAPPKPRIDRSFVEQTFDFETAILNGALAAERGHQGRAAERLGLTYHQFRGLLRKHRLGSDRARREAMQAEPKRARVPRTSTSGSLEP
jgi:psp operon transcriptional activator